MLAILSIAPASHSCQASTAHGPLPGIEVVVVGAGISGLTAALEAARGGAKVTVLDMSSVFGGHAVMAEGGVNIVDSPRHHAEGIHDSAELAYKDFVTWGEDVSTDWVRYYVTHSRREVYDWLTELGVVFDKIRVTGGNSVPRFHEARGRGLGLVTPIYRECVSHANITFAWNTQATGLTVNGGRVTGVEARDLRTGQVRHFRASAVILATGGFQNSLQLLREHWPKGVQFPDRLLLGSGVNSIGLGHELAQRAGAALSHMDYQWNYPYGIPDPRHRSEGRGLNAKSTGSIWLNANGQRFINEVASPKFSFPAMLKQRGATFWAIFDAQTKPFFEISGTDWGDAATVQRLIFDNPDLVKIAGSIADLANATGLPGAQLIESIRRYNALVGNGDDTDFGRFGPSSERYKGQTIRLLTPPLKIERPPFYAVQFFPLTRKSNGGVRVDLSCHVLDAANRPIPGLFAVGELTGSAGINGKAGLEGVWLGPGIAMGRVAARAVLKESQTAATKTDANIPVTSNSAPIVSENKSCTDCHGIDALIAKPRSGYWHFEKVHGVVLERRQNCIECHAELNPSATQPHRINKLVQTATCASCHGAR